MGIIIPSGVKVGGYRGIMVSKSLSTPVVDPTTALLLAFHGRNVTGITSGNPFGDWKNTGAAGLIYNLKQATGSKQPIWQSANANFNNKPTVKLDAVDDGMASLWDLSIPYVIYLVARAVDLSIQSSNRTVNSATPTNNRLISINRSADAVYLDGDLLSSTALNGTSAHIITIEIGLQSHVWIDGVDLTAGHTSQTFDWGLFGIGAVGSNAEPANAEIAFVGANDSARDTIIEAYLQNEYQTPALP